MPKVTLINCTELAAETLVFTKRTRLNMTADSWHNTVGMPDEEIMKELDYMANTIPSSWEFVDYIFMIEGVTRAFTHQFVRTRHGSYAQQTMRIVDMADFGYTSTAKTGQGKEAESRALEAIKQAYRQMLEAGEEIEDARGILPTNIQTNIVAKFNLRTMADLAKSRTGGRTQGEYREVMKMMTDEILNVHPWAEKFLFPKGVNYFDDLEKEVANVKDWGIRSAILKVIDKMRKN